METGNFLGLATAGIFLVAGLVGFGAGLYAVINALSMNESHFNSGRRAFSYWSGSWFLHPKGLNQRGLILRNRVVKASVVFFGAWVIGFGMGMLNHYYA